MVPRISITDDKGTQDLTNRSIAKRDPEATGSRPLDPCRVTSASLLQVARK